MRKHVNHVSPKARKHAKHASKQAREAHDLADSHYGVFKILLFNNY